jgi:hypothetical protein
MKLLTDFDLLLDNDDTIAIDLGDHSTIKHGANRPDVSTATWIRFWVVVLLKSDPLAPTRSA